MFVVVSALCVLCVFRNPDTGEILAGVHWVWVLGVKFEAFYLLIWQIGVAKNGKYSKTGFMVTVSPLVLHNMKKLEHMKNVSENCEKEVIFIRVQYISIYSWTCSGKALWVVVSLLKQRDRF